MAMYDYKKSGMQGSDPVRTCWLAVAVVSAVVLLSTIWSFESGELKPIHSQPAANVPTASSPVTDVMQPNQPPATPTSPSQK